MQFDQIYLNLFLKPMHRAESQIELFYIIIHTFDIRHLHGS